MKTDRIDCQLDLRSGRGLCLSSQGEKREGGREEGREGGREGVASCYQGVFKNQGRQHEPQLVSFSDQDPQFIETAILMSVHAAP